MGRGVRCILVNGAVLGMESELELELLSFRPPSSLQFPPNGESGIWDLSRWE